MERQSFFPNSKVIEWFERQKRDLPWREEPSAYRVWISEVMLQQTRVSVVLEYFTRWMARFPTIQTLSEAPLEEVIKMWEGLGYYSRARNLHEGAKQCMRDFEGQLPEDEALLSSIKGIGPYTLSAILNFAFHKKKPLLDGNVLRVLSRFMALESSIDLPQTRGRIEKELAAWLPEKKFWVVSEALMEIGALICVKTPKCQECPLQENCLGYQKGIAAHLPIRKERKKVISLERYVTILEYEGQVALRQAEKGQIMADLYEFPYSSDRPLISEEREFLKELPKVKHHFTHFRVTLFPAHYRAKKREEGWIWVDKDKLLELPFSSGHRRVLEKYIEDLT